MKTKLTVKILIPLLSAALVTIPVVQTTSYAAPPPHFDRLEPHGFGHFKGGPRGRWHRGFGIFTTDTDAFKWLAFTAITIKLLDNLNEEQKRAHETAQIEATQAEVGETITWNKDGASGSVKVTRDGTSSSGRYCREFQQKISVGGKQESAYGTACRQPDGSWEVVSTK